MFRALTDWFRTRMLWVSALLNAWETARTVDCIDRDLTQLQACHGRLASQVAQQHHRIAILDLKSANVQSTDVLNALTHQTKTLAGRVEKMERRLLALEDAAKAPANRKGRKPARRR